MTEEQTNDMMLLMEQLAGDIRELTYAIRENTEVVERGERRIALTQGEIKDRARISQERGVS